MGRIKKTVAVVLVIIILLALASIGYMCMRIFWRKRKKDETENEEDEIDPDLLAMQKTVVEKTPLAVEGEENFVEEDDETLMVCKRGKFWLCLLHTC